MTDLVQEVGEVVFEEEQGHHGKVDEEQLESLVLSHLPEFLLVHQLLRSVVGVHHLALILLFANQVGV